MLLAMFELKSARLMMRKHSSIFVRLLLLIRIPMKNAWLRVCTLKQLFEVHDQILYIDKSKVRIFHNLDFLKGIE